MKRILFAVSAMAVAVAATPASAANYVFDVTYNGNGNATLNAGSADPRTTTLQAGDSFTYTLSAFGNSFWQTNANVTAYFALGLSGNFSSSNIAYQANLLNDGTSVFSNAATEGNCCAHLGPNILNLASGLTFDQARVAVTINSIGNPGAANKLLPFSNAFEQGNPSTITFTPLAATAAVPEPATWAMMMLGFGGMGYALRRRRKDQVRIRFA